MDHFKLQFGLSRGSLLTVPVFLCLHHLNAPIKRSELVQEKLDLVPIGIGIHLAFRLQFGLSRGSLLTVPDFLCLHHLNAPVKMSELVQELLEIVPIGIGIYQAFERRLL